MQLYFIAKNLLIYFTLETNKIEYEDECIR